MADIQPGFTYSDVAGAPNNNLNAQNLHELVGNAVILPAFVSAKTLKSPAALSDKLLIEDGGVLKYTSLQQLHDLILYPGGVVQTVYAGAYTASIDLIAVIPSDDTIPQSGEGTEILTASITPRFATSTVLVTLTSFGAVNTASDIIAALFRGSGVDALIATAQYGSGSNERRYMGFTYMDSPATTSATTYAVRVGPGVASSLRMNGSPGGGRMFGGAARATLLLQEIKV